MPVGPRPVTELGRRWFNRKGVIEIDGANAPEGIDHDASFRRQLRFIGHVLKIAAATDACYRTRGRDTQWRWIQYLGDNSASGFAAESGQPGTNCFTLDPTADQIGHSGAMREPIAAWHD